MDNYPTSLTVLRTLKEVGVRAELFFTRQMQSWCALDVYGDRYMRNSTRSRGIAISPWLVTLIMVVACGDHGLPTDTSKAMRTDAAALAAPSGSSLVRVCSSDAATSTAATSSLGFNLIAGGTYAGDIVPLVSAKCVSCHGGDGSNGQQNSTTCGYLERNIDNVILRLQNSLAGEAQKIIEDAKPDGTVGKLNNNGIRDLVSGRNRNTWPMPPIGQNQARRITQSDIDILTAWKDVPDKCVDTSAPDGAIAAPTAYTDEEDERLRKSKIFEGASCKDGPTIASDRSKVEGILTLPVDSPSAFYDYEAKEFVAGARPMDGDCSIDYFLSAFAVIPGAREVLQSYKDYGWWVTQCAVVGGRPQAYLAHVAKVTTALGDTTYGVFLKLLKIAD